jgi:8-oxo-dGTP pyrophosphatase MutT (NUDIX family)
MAIGIEEVEAQKTEIGEQTVSAFGLILTPDGVLFLENERDQAFEFPGGGLDEGETPVECYTRELEEEAAFRLNIQQYPPRLIFRVINKDGQFIDIYENNILISERDRLPFTPLPYPNTREHDHKSFRYFSKEELLIFAGMPRDQRPKFAGLDFFLDMALKALDPSFRGVDNDLHEVRVNSNSVVETTNSSKILAYQSAISKFQKELEIIN